MLGKSIHIHMKGELCNRDNPTYVKFKVLVGKKWDLRLRMGNSVWIQKIE